ncbi:tetratricopeptide repeat protein [Ruegeria sediminis]|nr:tetratricopeptide repeat protein [Ruegeria sediminis]
MSIAYPNLKGIVAAVAFIVTFSGSGVAEETISGDEATLLDQLSQADPPQALRIDRELQAIWMKSGSASADLLLARGREALDVGDVETAIEHLTALTDHAPEFAEGWHARASAFFGQERYGLALADLERALALNPSQYEAIFGLGLIFEALGRPEQAYAAYSRALSIHPHHEEVTNAVNRLKPRIEGEAL